jgi:glycosyltransferase involved in cell wall biosynthesis
MYDMFMSVVDFARLHDRAFVLSPVHYMALNRWTLLKNRRRTRHGRHPLRRRGWLARSADHLLPNSQEEAVQIRHLFGIAADKVTVVPNGVDAKFRQGDPNLFREKFGIQGPFVLNVARIEDRKNQPRLLEAIGPLGYPLVVMGAIADDGVYQACKRLAKDSTRFLPPLDHDDPLLASAFAACKVFALPSLLETPGIAALEAGLAGAKVVTTPIGGGREYFGDFARYVDPLSVSSIREAIAQAWADDSPSEPLQTRLVTEFSWEQIARRTLAVYESVLRSRAS